MKISGFTDEAATMLDAQLSIMSALGQKYFCPRNIDRRNISDYSYKEFMSSVKPRLDKAGVGISSIGSPYGKIGLDDDVKYERQLKQLKESARIAEAVGCKYIRIFSFYPDPDRPYREALPAVLKKLGGFLNAVRDRDVILLHENEKRIYGDTPERVNELYEVLNETGQFKLCFDASNYLQSGCDAFDAYEKTKHNTVYYHMKDCLDTVEVPLGLGQGRIGDILSDLALRGYDGFLTLEPHTVKYALLHKYIKLLPGSGALEKYKRVYSRTDGELFGGRAGRLTRRGAYMLQFDRLEDLMKKAGAERDG